MQPLLVSSSYRITWLQYSYGCPILNVACVFKLHLQNHSVPYFKSNLSLYTLPTKSLGYTTLMGVQYYVQPMFVISTYSTTWLQNTYRSPTLSTAYVCKLFLQNYWVTLHLWVSNLKCNLCLLAQPTGLLRYTTLIGVLSYAQAMFLCSAYKINGYT